MSGYSVSDNQEELFKKENFDVRTLEDEIRVDGLCQSLLRLYYLDLVEQGSSPETAGVLTWGADYFLREFVIPDRRENIFDLRPGRTRQFAGNWYIAKNLEPNMEELDNILRGVRAFYEYGHKGGKVSEETVGSVRRECAKLDYYRQRIEDFWAIEGDGFVAWERECSLKDEVKGKR
jgi:hypothetical protein